MGIINSPVRRIDLGHFLSANTKAKHLAASKKIVRKQERARLRQQARRDLIQDHLLDLAEKKEQARLEREMVYQQLMDKFVGKKHTRRDRAHRVQPVESHDGNIEERFLFRVLNKTIAGESHFEVLASCAMA